MFQFKDLLNGQNATITGAIAELKQLLTGSGFVGITDWQPGTFQNDLLQLAAYFYVQGQQRAATLAQNSIVCPSSLGAGATGAFLTHLAKGFFDVDRVQSAPSQRYIDLTISPGFGPFNEGPGVLDVTFDGLYTYSNTLALSLVNTGVGPVTTAIPFTCTTANAGSNVIASPTGSMGGSTILPGVSAMLTSASYDIASGTVGGGFPSSIITYALEDQSDQSLRLQCATQWTTLATAEPVADRVINTVLSASQGQLSDVYVDATNPNGPGSVDVYCSTSLYAGTTSQISAITSAVQSLFFAGSQTLPGRSNPLINLLAPYPFVFGTVHNHPITVFYVPGTNTVTLISSLINTLNAWIASIPTGGLSFSPTYQNVAPIDQLATMLTGLTGVRTIRIADQNDVVLNQIGYSTAYQKLVSPFLPGQTTLAGSTLFQLVQSNW